MFSWIGPHERGEVVIPVSKVSCFSDTGLRKSCIFNGLRKWLFGAVTVTRMKREIATKRFKNRAIMAWCESFRSIAGLFIIFNMFRSFPLLWYAIMALLPEVPKMRKTNKIRELQTWHGMCLLG